MPLDTTSRLLTPFLGQLTEEELDAVPYGIVELDHQGIVRSYNRAEAENVGVHARPVGRSYFTDVYPSANAAEFHSLFLQGVADGRTESTFIFTFTCGSLPRRVCMRMYYCVRTRSTWLFTARPDGLPLGLTPGKTPAALRPTPTHGIDLRTPRVA